MQPVVSFGRVFFGLWNRFFLCALPGSPRPLVRCKSTLLPYRRGWVFAGCIAAKGTAQWETALCTEFFLLPLRGYG